MKSFWQNVPYRPRKSLRGNVRADVAIVGGGITGVSAAYHLAKAGFKCVLVEKDIIAGGPAGKNMGLVVEGTTLDLQEMIPMVGPTRAKEVWQRTIEAQTLFSALIRKERISCDVKRSGSLYVATDKKWVPWLKREAALRNKCGFPCRFLDKGRLKSVVSSSFEAALFDLKDFQVHPVKFVRGLASRAEKYGAQLYEHSPALKWNAHQVKTSKGVVTAEKVIVAIESKTPFLRPHRKNAQVIVTNPLRNAAKLGWKRGHMLWEVGLHYHAVRFWNNRLMVAKEIPNNSTERQKKVHAEKMVRLLLRDFPVLSKDDVSVSHRWDCFVVHSQRGIFTISHEHGVYYVYGCAGNGLTHGTLAGKIFADHFSGKPLPKIYVPSSNVRLSGCTW